MIIVVNYDLKGPAGNYAPLYQALQQQGEWWHYMTSTWLISTTVFTPHQIAERLRPLILQGDWLLVSQLSAGYDGWLPKDAWDWINSRPK